MLRGRRRRPALVAVLLLCVAAALVSFSVIRSGFALESGVRPGGGEPLASPAPLPVVVVLVMKTTVDVQKFPARVKAILNSWGDPAYAQRLVETKRCNFDVRVRFVSSELVDKPKFYRVQHAQSSDKTKALISALEQSQEEFQERLAWVAKGDDITFFNLGNLCTYLSKVQQASPPRQQFVFAGNKLGMDSKGGNNFLSGGAGFVLSARLVQTLIKRLWPAHCEPAFRDEFSRRSEDVTLASCFSRYQRDPSVELIDALDSGDTQLFNVYDPVRSIRNDYDDWYEKYKANLEVKKAPQCCSRSFVTFHYVEAPLQAFLHSCVESKSVASVLGNSLENWPRHVGGYAKRPKQQDKNALVALLSN